MASEANDRAKRQRVSRNATVQLSHLPDALLAYVGAYLPMTSRGLFAAAMTASPASWQECEWQCAPSLTSKAIMGQVQGEELDFEDVERSLRFRLSDADIGGVLVCVDAVRTLRSLKLTHCFGVTGSGLKPLRGSMVLSRIDLSLVGLHESPVIDGEIALSVRQVAPVLESIMEQGDSSLVHVQLPKKWRDKQKDEVASLWTKYEAFLDGRGTICQTMVAGTTCRRGVQTAGEPLATYGIQDTTCYKCLQHYCHTCRYEDCQLGFCQDCERVFCTDCVCVRYCDEAYNCTGGKQASSCSECNNTVRRCSICEDGACPQCRPVARCSHCGEEACADCILVCNTDGCSRKSCRYCAEEGAEDAVAYCTECDEARCIECRVQKYRGRPESGVGCSECARIVRIIAPALIDENDEPREE